MAWDGVGYVHDQAVLFLKEEFNLGDHVSPICLPDSASDYTAEECFVSGYGKNGSGVYQTTLHTAQVKKNCMKVGHHLIITPPLRLRDSARLVCAKKFFYRFYSISSKFPRSMLLSLVVRLVIHGYIRIRIMIMNTI